MIVTVGQPETKSNYRNRVGRRSRLRNAVLCHGCHGPTRIERWARPGLGRKRRLSCNHDGDGMGTRSDARRGPARRRVAKGLKQLRPGPGQAPGRGGGRTLLLGPSLRRRVDPCESRPGLAARSYSCSRTRTRRSSKLKVQVGAGRKSGVQSWPLWPAQDDSGPVLVARRARTRRTAGVAPTLAGSKLRVRP